MFAQPLCTLTVLGDQGKEIEGAADCGEPEEPEGKGVGSDVPGGIAGHDAEGSDGHSAGTEANLEGGTNAASQVSTDY